MIQELFVPIFEGISAQPASVTVGSPKFEYEYHRLIEKLGYARPVVWRGVMPPVKSPISFIDKYESRPNRKGIIQAESFLSREDKEGNGVNFFLSYQGVLGMHDTLMTIIFSSDLAVVTNRAIQTAKHGTYIPKLYRADCQEKIPSMDGYVVKPVSIEKITRIFPQIESIINLEKEIYITLRLASFLFQKTYPLYNIDGTDLLVNIYCKYPLTTQSRQKYLAEITQVDGRSGVSSFNNMRVWETNESAQGILKRWKGPIPAYHLTNAIK